MKRRDWFELALIVALALALRLALWWLLPRDQLVSDEPEYLAAASWLAHGRGFSFYAEWPWLRPPLYLLFLAPWMRFFGLDLAPIRLAQLVLSLSVPVLTYLLARASLGRRAAVAAGLLTALWLPLAMLPHLVLAENLFLPLLLAAMLCLVRFQKEMDRDGSDVGPLLRRASTRWALAGGLLLGLAALTRGMTVGFFPLAALWVLWISWRQGRSRRRFLSALATAVLLSLAALLVILPWTGYNYLRYGKLILVDTTGGYNLWLGTQGGQFQHIRDVNTALLEQPDPAARQAYAYRQGLEAVAADPAHYLLTRVTELGQLLRINYGADERLLDGFTQGTVPAPYLVGVFLLEDSLYMLLVPLALLGVLGRRGEPGRGLMLLWFGYNILAGVIFFAIGRFRLPLLPFLAVYAASLLVERRWPMDQREERPLPAPRLYSARLALAGVLAVAFWFVAGPSYLGDSPASSGATVLGLYARSAATRLAQAEAAIRAGQLGQAETWIAQAESCHPQGTIPSKLVQVVEAERLRAAGVSGQASDLLSTVESYQAHLLRGDLLRAQGDITGAQREFGERDVQTRNPTAWAWSHLAPPVASRVDVGGGLDWGLVDGFYQVEQEGQTTLRWSGEQARLRFPGAGTGQPLVLRLRLRGWRPTGEASAEVVVELDGVSVGRFTPSSDWSKVEVQLPAVPAARDVVVSLRVNGFVAGPRDLLQTGQLRVLGVMVDWAEVAPSLSQ